MSVYPTRVPYHHANALCPWGENVVVLLYTETQREVIPDEMITLTSSSSM